VELNVRRSERLPEVKTMEARRHARWVCRIADALFSNASAHVPAYGRRSAGQPRAGLAAQFSGAVLLCAVAAVIPHRSEDEPGRQDRSLPVSGPPHHRVGYGAVAGATASGIP
jgi:hypothetical protein